MKSVSMSFRGLSAIALLNEELSQRRARGTFPAAQLALADELKTATAAVMLPHHNGRTEGVNTKTKKIKRDMFGRAGFELLRHRILLGLRHGSSPPELRQSR